MDAIAKRKWIDALRSGIYSQGRYGMKLTGSNSYCCLGVLCETQGLHRDKTKLMSFDTFTFPKNMGKETASVPEGYLGLTKEDIATCVVMNDTLDRSFDEIADYIEENF